jgi:hypothetical protein
VQRSARAAVSPPQARERTRHTSLRRPRRIPWQHPPVRTQKAKPAGALCASEAGAHPSTASTSTSAPWYSKVVTPALALGMFMLWGAVNLLLLQQSIPDGMREIVIRMLGSLDAANMLILSYYFGNSHKH